MVIPHTIMNPNFNCTVYIKWVKCTPLATTFVKFPHEKAISSVTIETEYDITLSDHDRVHRHFSSKNVSASQKLHYVFTLRKDEDA